MTKVPETRKTPFGLKPVVILTLAVILLGKPQRVLTDDEVTSTTGSAMDPSPSTCPDFCNLPSDSATRGKAPFRMWYFDSSEGECRRFRWGGRGGNENRFRKKTDCENTCSKCLNKTTEDDNHQDSQEIENGMKDLICSPPKDEGRCNPSDSRSRPIKSPQLAWYFEPTTERCSPFVYFGCGGNSNRFFSRSECEEICI